MDFASVQHSSPGQVLRSQLAKTTCSTFLSTFNQPPGILAIAPGRVNLIGEHTDYNEGFVLPAAINRHVAVAAAPRSDGQLVIHSAAYRSIVRSPVDALRPSARDPWSNYVKGVASLLARNGIHVPGATLSIAGTIPQGSGLSSSAALELAVCGALAALSGEPPDMLTQVRLCREAENTFVGVQCGIMDQYVCGLAKRGHLLFLDCRDLSFRHIPFPAGVDLVICHSGVQRTLTGSPYNDRRQECLLAVQQCSGYRPPPASLRDLTPDALQQVAPQLAPIPLKRARHVVTENVRVRDAVEALRRNDLSEFGKLMYQSHMSLKNDFEVSCPELDAIVDIAAETEGVYGARMTGAGFGGSAVCLVDSSCTEALVQRLETEYPARTTRPPLVLRCQTDDGVSVSPY